MLGACYPVRFQGRGRGWRWRLGSQWCGVNALERALIKVGKCRVRKGRVGLEQVHTDYEEELVLLRGAEGLGGERRRSRLLPRSASGRWRLLWGIGSAGLPLPLSVLSQSPPMYGTPVSSLSLIPLWKSPWWKLSFGLTIRYRCFLNSAWPSCFAL